MLLLVFCALTLWELIAELERIDSLAEILRRLHELQDPGHEGSALPYAMPANWCLLEETSLICPVHCCNLICWVTDQDAIYEQGAYSGPDDSSITTISSTLKTAAVRAICPAIAVASSGDCALSMAAADTAMATVRCCGLILVPEDPAALHNNRGALNMWSMSDKLNGRAP